ncbi:hypothetical protein PPACK8108_LOCUS16176 [Phakopsora pachyrhizi]|uniref:Uncharacterized protein n=1 Tax=Phakopsora pachyrhizi TaxID=170000 RepID=A0AAV0B8Z5_PHAPC|nr:hypothetical protein PPACK8108_LOCUS16176 [Phakopsora pachyrhizi]
MDISALTLDILNNAKRYHTTVSFLADTGIKEASNNGLILFKELFHWQRLFRKILPRLCSRF